MREIWKDVDGFEGYYQVSNLGRIKSLSRVVNNYPNCTRTLPERVIRGHVNKHIGYVVVSLSGNGKKMDYVHRLVAKAFIPNPNNYPFINHKDENKTNNRIDNLEWCTPNYNIEYSGVRTKSSEKASIPVLKYDMDGNMLARYRSATEAATELGVESYCIGLCCKGKIGSVKGYLWRYEDEGVVKVRHTRVLARRVVQMDMEGRDIKMWPSIVEAARETHSNGSLIGRCCNGHRVSTNGFKWRYYDKEPIVF